MSGSKQFSILVCRGPECGGKRGSAEVYAAFERLRMAVPAGRTVALEQYSCFGRCHSGVNVLVREILPGDNTSMLRLMPTAGKGAVLYHRVQPSEARRILEEHVGAGRPIVEYTTRK